jgi:hypothetical protein
MSVVRWGGPGELIGLFRSSYRRKPRSSEPPAGAPLIFIERGKLLTKDEARRIAVNIAKLPETQRQNFTMRLKARRGAQAVA